MSSGLRSTNEEHEMVVQGLGTQVIKSCNGSPERTKVPLRAPAVSRYVSKMPTQRDRGT